MYAGKSVMKQFVTQASYSAPAGFDTYLVFAPTPGVAFWESTVATGTLPTAFSGNAFADAPQVFDTFSVSEQFDQDPQSSSSLVDRFRFTGLSAELECTNNDFTWAGNITVAKSQIRLQDGEILTALSDGYLKATLTGLEAINFLKSGNGQVYRGPINKGFYSVSGNTDATFHWNDVRPSAFSNSKIRGGIDDGPLMSRRARLPPTSVDRIGSEYCGVMLPPPRAGQPAPPPNTPRPVETGLGAPAEVVFTGPLAGMGAYDSILVKITVPAGAAAQTFILKSWQNIEFAPIAMSLFSEMAMRAPAHDQLALEAYKYIVQGLPVAVEQKDNPDFWKFVKRILAGAKKTLLLGSGALSKTPGDIGVVAKGVHTLLNAL